MIIKNYLWYIHNEESISLHITVIKLFYIFMHCLLKTHIHINYNIKSSLRPGIGEYLSSFRQFVFSYIHVKLFISLYYPELYIDTYT